MTQDEKLATEQIRKCIADVRELGEKVQADDKQVVSNVLDRLMEIQNMYQEIFREEEPVDKKDGFDTMDTY